MTDKFESSGPEMGKINDSFSDLEKLATLMRIVMVISLSHQPFEGRVTRAKTKSFGDSFLFIPQRNSRVKPRSDRETLAVGREFLLRHSPCGRSLLQMERNQQLNGRSRIRKDRIILDSKVICGWFFFLSKSCPSVPISEIDQ